MTRWSRWHLVLGLGGALAVACGGGSGTDDAGGMTGDSGVRVDSGGGTTDGGPGDDGGGGDDAGGGSDGGGMASCSNAVLDGTETDVDCGGDCPGCPTGDMCAIGADCLSASCVGETCAAPACDDGLQNGDETAIDCGGGTCPGCPVGTGCTAGSDCASGVCGSRSGRGSRRR